MTRALTAAIVCFLACGASISSAAGATYEVRACSHAAGFVNHSWATWNSTAGAQQLETGNGCAGSGSFGGLFARDDLSCISACVIPPSGSSAGWTFNAPAGTTITALAYERWLYKKDDDDWEPFLKANGTTVETCRIASGTSCSVGLAGGETATLAFPGVSSLDIGVLCRPNPYNNCVGGGTLHDVAAVLYGATVTLSDPSTPTVSNLAGSLFDSGYLRGSRSVSFDATDNAGIASARIYVDGSPQPATRYSCDPTYPVPCVNQSGAQVSLDTRTLTDGTHSVALGVSDPAANEATSQAHTVTVDNTAPSAPQTPSVDGGDGWHPANSFAVSWINPSGQVSPIAIARYRVCSADGLTCGAEQATGATNVSRLDGVTVPTTGEWQLKIRLEDAAGNTDPSRIATAMLRYGSAPTQTQTDPATSTTTAAAAPTASAPTDETAVLTEPLTPITVLATPSLRVTSARYSHGRLVLRGRTAMDAAGTVVFRVRVGHRTVRHKRHVPGGAFRLMLRTGKPAAKLLVRFSATAFRSQTVNARLR